jgi:hypothetical protein
MVFVIAHFSTIEESKNIENVYLEKYKQVILCGSTNVLLEKNETLPYHPLFIIENKNTTIAEQHTYIDTMLRAIQIEVPEKIIFHSATMFDTHTVLYRIKQHCEIVGVEIATQ